MSYYLQLLRINHWFKNIFIISGVLVGIWYIGQYNLNSLLIIKVLGAFFLASLISSANYIINQIADKKFDKLHPTKKHRPIPSNKISVHRAWNVAGIIFLVVILFSNLFYSFEFTLCLISLFVAGILYNIPPIRLKDIVFVDVVSESFNNPIRFLIGWFVVVSSYFPPLVILLITWTAGAILMSGKRYDEIVVLGKKLVPYRKSFKFYSKTRLSFMIVFYTILTLFLFIAIALQYNPNLILSFPLMTVFLFWINRRIINGKAQARTVENFMLTKSFILFSLVVVTSIIYIIFIT